MHACSSARINLNFDELLERFITASERQRRTLRKSVEGQVAEVATRIPALLDRFDPRQDDWIPGWLIQLAVNEDPEAIIRLQKSYPEGWLDTPSDAGLDYTTLQIALQLQQFEEADRLTNRALRELAGSAAIQRGYVYYSEVVSIISLDLITLDRLWSVYSLGRFGFTAQRKLLQACNGRWEQLWPRIGWKTNGVWTRYPSAFDWSLEAPEGHMPMINQLRGIRLMDALLKHPAFKEHLGTTN
ncbi:hypothetical protein PMYN1_Chma203 (chromatophore) [Paulinella micropora]|uniref:GUN4-like domain-containing protein n=1 Tax=Paulinella micropora TaxID=1928728 RepID=A0A1S6YHL7_9EUKA|nr:hypothetical protein PFK_240 [Paulinella micropora]BBL86015.1 hypothetical protein PMYN1_Chma203 [Paulinella micropora]